MVGEMGSRKLAAQAPTDSPSGTEIWYEFQLECTEDPTGSVGFLRTLTSWQAEVDATKTKSKSAILVGGFLPTGYTTYSEEEVRYLAIYTLNGPKKDAKARQFTFSILGSSTHTCKTRSGYSQASWEQITQGITPAPIWGNWEIVSHAAGGIPGTAPDGSVKVSVELTFYKSENSAKPQVDQKAQGNLSGAEIFSNVSNGGSGSGTWLHWASGASANAGGNMQSIVMGIPEMSSTGWIDNISGATNLLTIKDQGYGASFGPVNSTWRYRVVRRKMKKEPGKDEVVVEDWAP